MTDHDGARTPSRILTCCFALALGSAALADQAAFLNYQDAPVAPPPPPGAATVDKALKNTWPVKAADAAPAPAPADTVAPAAGANAVAGGKKTDLLGSVSVAVNLTSAPLAAPTPVPVPRNTADLPVCVAEDATESAPSGAEAFSCIPSSDSQLWSAESNQTVRTTLKKWAEKAGWTLVWRAERDWTIPAGFTHSGQFEGAGAWMFKQLSAEGVLIRVRFYEGNRTVVVSPPAS